MSTYTKIKKIVIRDLNNAEYLAFMNGVMNLIPKSAEEDSEDIPELMSLDDAAAAAQSTSQGSEALGLSAEFISAMENDLMKLADVVNESRIAQETEEAQRHEANRDSLATYILTRISRSGTLPLEAERDAGKFLYKVIKPYIGIARLPVAQESAAIRGLILDLRKSENAPYVTTLALDGYISELESENNAYIALTSTRTKNRAANALESGTEIRKRTDVQYDDLVTVAQAYSIAQPSDEASTFVKNINQLITETVTAYNQREKAPRKKKAGSSSTDDAPVMDEEAEN